MSPHAWLARQRLDRARQPARDHRPDDRPGRRRGRAGDRRVVARPPRRRGRPLPPRLPPDVRRAAELPYTPVRCGVRTLLYGRVATEKRQLTAHDWAVTALEAMGQGGAAAVAIEPLAKRLGATRGSFYWHFSRAATSSGPPRALGAPRDRGRDRVGRGDGRARERLRALLLARSEHDRARGRRRARAAGERRRPDVAEALARVTQRRLAYLADQFAALGHDRTAPRARVMPTAPSSGMRARARDAVVARVSADGYVDRGSRCSDEPVAPPAASGEGWGALQVVALGTAVGRAVTATSRETARAARARARRVVGAVPDRGDRATAFWFLVPRRRCGASDAPGARRPRRGRGPRRHRRRRHVLMPGGFPAVAARRLGRPAPARHRLRDASVTALVGDERRSAVRARATLGDTDDLDHFALTTGADAWPRARAARCRGRRRNGRPGDLARAGDSGGPPTVARPRRRLDHRRTRCGLDPAGRESWWGRASSWCTATPSRSRSRRSSPTSRAAGRAIWGAGVGGPPSPRPGRCAGPQGARAHLRWRIRGAGRGLLTGPGAA